MNYFQLTHRAAVSAVDSLHRRVMSWIGDAVGRECLECEFSRDGNKRAMSAEEKAWNLYCLGSSNHGLRVVCNGKRRVFHIPFESVEELSMRLAILGF